jgi:hypothetical protein
MIDIKTEMNSNWFMRSAPLTRYRAPCVLGQTSPRSNVCNGWKADIGERQKEIVDAERSFSFTTRTKGPATRSRMSDKESERKRRKPESAERRSERLEQEADERDADTKADDANVQRMIERSIKDYGA